jgi:hypothetical protein
MKKKVLVLGIIIIFIFTGIIPSINASIDNKHKADSTIWVFGLMRPLTTQSNQTKVFVILALYKTQGLPGGILQPFHYYYFWDMVDFTKKFWAFCWCSDITES